MTHPIQAKKGTQEEHDSFSGPSSYPSGGFSHRSDLGRVDQADAEIDRGDFVAHVESINNNNALVIEVHSQGSGEANAGTDFSNDQVRTNAYRL